MTPRRRGVAGAAGFVRRLDEALFPDAMQVFERSLADELRGCESVLDVGCGSHSPMRALAADIPLTVGVDGHLESIERSRRAGIHTRYECLDLLDLPAHFEPRTFDAVVALDVIEHFHRDDGFRLLDAMEAVARRRVVVLTPNGFLPQEAYDGNPAQVHRSGWEKADFEARGYRVVGINGWRPLRGELAVPRVRPAALGWRLASASQRLVAARPHLAFHLLAVLDVGSAPSDPVIPA